MSQLRFLTLGVGDAFSARYYSSCFLLEAAGRRLLIDCPHPIRKILREASTAVGPPLDLDGIDAVVLTHLHADHASGLEGLGYYGRFFLGRKFPLLVHPAVAADLWTGSLAGGMEWSRSGDGAPPTRRCMADFFDLVPLSETDAVTVGPFSLRCRPTNHSIFTTALMIQAAGRSLGYSADTAFDPTLIDWLAPADLIVHEASGGYQHTPYEALTGISADVRQKMRLIHYPDDFDTAASVIEPLRQGAVYEV